MCPPPTRWGRNVRQPCTTPQKLTPITHSHDEQRAEPGIRRAGNAGVVAHHVDSAEALERRAARACDLFVLADVRADRQHVDAVGADLLRRRGEGVVLHVGEHEVEPGGTEAIGERQPDAAPAAVTTAT